MLLLSRPPVPVSKTTSASRTLSSDVSGARLDVAALHRAARAGSADGSQYAAPSDAESAPLMAPKGHLSLSTSQAAHHGAYGPPGGDDSGPALVQPLLDDDITDGSELTVRSVVVGALVGSVVCMSNVWYGLKTSMSLGSSFVRTRASRPPAFDAVQA